MTGVGGFRGWGEAEGGTRAESGFKLAAAASSPRPFRVSAVLNQIFGPDDTLRYSVRGNGSGAQTRVPGHCTAKGTRRASGKWRT